MSVFLFVLAINPSDWAKSSKPGDFRKVWVFDSANPYLAECLGARKRAESRWLCAVSFWLPAGAVEAMRGKKAFVAEGRYETAGGKDHLYDYGETGRQQVEAISVDKVHDAGYIGTGVRVAVLDAGFDLNHPCLRHIKGTDRLKAQHDFNSGDSLFSQAGRIALPGFPPDEPSYVNSMSLSVQGAMSVLAFSASTEDSLASPGSNRWNIYFSFGDNQGVFSSPTKLSAGYFATRPSLSFLSGDTFGLAWQEGTTPRVRFAKIRHNNPSPFDVVNLGEGIDPKQASSGANVYVFYYVPGYGIYEAHSTDYGTSFSTGTLIIPLADYWGMGSAMFQDTPVILASDGSSLNIAWYDGSVWQTGFIDQGTLPCLFASDSLYIAYWRGDTLIFGSSPGPSGGFAMRPITVCPMPSPASVGIYGGQVVIASEDSAGTITLYGKSGNRIARFGEEFSEKPALSSGVLVWERRGDGSAETPTAGPGHYHGTKILSVIAGLVEKTLVGTAPGCDLLLAKCEKVVTSQAGSFENLIEEDFWVEALEWAGRHGARIVNSSLGYRDWYFDSDMDGKTAPSSRAAGRALSENILIFNSMGNVARSGPPPLPNVGDTSLSAPADAFGICAIGGVEWDSLNGVWVPSYSSAYGPSADGRTKPELVAPFWAYAAADTVFFGEQDTTFYLFFSGTSFSSALSAGAAACVWQAHPSWSADSLRKVLLRTGSDIPGYTDANYLTGWGMLNAWDALNAEPPEVPGSTRDAITRIYPNPFNPDRAAGVRFEYQMLSRSSFSELLVYTIDGLLVWSEAHDEESPGSEEPYFWDGRTGSGARAQPGLYLVVFRTQKSNDVKKLMIVR
ncbi:MAG: S8 family serine peptidase [candidate division WOR-3 bacterium]